VDPAADATLIGETLQSLALPAVRVGARAIDAADRALLLPSELELVEGAVASRVDEFASGRVLLRELSGTAGAIPRRADRAPVMPAGFVGSLAHDRAIVVAAVAPASDVVALGIDVEPIVELEPDVATIVLRHDDGTDDPVLALVAKEAAFKAWSATHDGMLEHHDVRITFDVDRFVATVLTTGGQYRGRAAAVAGRWLALVVVAVRLRDGGRRGSR
jgi:4'-phosphopantetheinyl transferase EntD